MKIKITRKLFVGVLRADEPGAWSLGGTGFEPQGCATNISRSWRLVMRF